MAGRRAKGEQGREPAVEDYRDRPAEWVRRFLGGEPWAKQEEILQALAARDRVTVRACHGVGKTWTAAGAVLWFLYTREPAVVLTTAPTQRQVREVLWREVRRLHRKLFAPGSPAAGRYPQGEIRETALRLGDERFALGLTTDEPDRFQGFHAPHVLVVVDEASGVSEAIFEAIEGVLTTEGSRLLLIGNPLHARGTFYESHRRGDWARVAISAFDCPNVQGGDPWDPDFAARPPLLPGLVTARWVADRLRQWGPDSPLYQSRVLGEFPDQMTDALIHRGWIREAVLRSGADAHTRRRYGSTGEAVHFGVDVARFGDCETVVAIRQEDAVAELQAWRGADLMQTAGRILQLAREWQPVTIRVDAAGLGAGVADRLRDFDYGSPGEAPRILELNGGGTPLEPDRFGNRRDEAFFHLRDRFRSGEISLPDDRVLADQLAALTYWVDAKGKQRVTAKSDLRKRGLASPDRADALALAFAPVRLGPRLICFAGPAR